MVSGKRYRVGVMLTPEALVLCDPDTGEESDRVPLEKVGLSYRKGRYYPAKKKRDELVSMFLVARYVASRRTRH